MNETISFARFDAVLGALGFEKTVIPGSHVNYRHAASDTLLMIRLHKRTDRVPDYVLASTRLQLDGRGIITAKDFDEMLLQHTAA